MAIAQCYSRIEADILQKSTLSAISTGTLGRRPYGGGVFCDPGHRRLLHIAIVLCGTITTITERRRMDSQSQNDAFGRAFLEFRRKVRSAEVLSGAMEHLLGLLQFTGKVSVVVQNGRVLKSGYEEGYFRRSG
jgi:hypothetical protein